MANERAAEVAAKLRDVRAAMAAEGLSAVRLRGVDWFSWATGGGSSVVNMASEVGVAEVLVTAGGAWVLTDTIEAPRMREEEVPPGFQVREDPWADPTGREAFATAEAGGPVASDRPRAGAEHPLPDVLVAAKRRMRPAEVERYRLLGADAAEAVTDVLLPAHPGYSENALAGAAAEALWRHGIHPVVVLVAGARRLPRHRHATPTDAPLGRVAMLVVCGRRHGLYANLTRFVAFEALPAEERRLHEDVAAVEAAAFAASRPRATLAAAFGEIVGAYTRRGHAGEELRHHQGGTTGYLAREVVATPTTLDSIEPGTALAWNPSLPGAKIEDTVLVGDQGIELLTVDPRWPTVDVEGRARPAVLVRP